jgi:hypothetical protein
MSDILEGKHAPWANTQPVLAILEKEQESIKMLIRLKESNYLTIKELENKVLMPLLLIYQAIQTLFKDSNVLDVDF